MNRLILMLIFGLSLVLTACNKDENPASPSEPQGELYSVGDIKIPVLKGDGNRMGRQLGNLMRSEIRELYDLMVESRLRSHRFTYDELLREADLYWDTVIPPWMKALCDGLSMTGGLTLDQIKILQLMDIILLNREACSGIIAWEYYTDGGCLLIGHNLDNEEAVSYAHLLCVTVFKFTDSGRQFAVFGYPGIFSVNSGVNDAGLCVTMNAAPMADVFTARDLSRPWRRLMSFEWLMTCESLDMLRIAYLDAPVALGCNYLAADVGNGTCFETALDVILERNPDEDGLICETNHFIHHLLQEHNRAYFGDNTGTSSHLRWNNLVAILRDHKGAWTMSRLMDQVLQVPEDQGGVMNGSVVSFVFRPLDLTLLIGSPYAIEPVFIDLNNYFD